jgi:hypothetical protein
MCSSSTDGARLTRLAACMGIGGLSVSRPPLMNTTRCSVTWHAEQMNVWCSIPRTATVSSGTTFVRINSEPHAVQSIARTHLPDAHRTLDDDFGRMTSGAALFFLPGCSLFSAT